MIGIREVSDGKGGICDRLLRALPGWFGIEDAIRQYVADAEKMPMFAAFEGGAAIGFVSLNAHNEWTAEVHVMAIDPAYHRRGIGRDLLAAAEKHLRAARFLYLTVKTVSGSRQSPEYVLTREFYFAMGFRPVEEFKTLWGEHNPCLLMIKPL